MGGIPAVNGRGERLLLYIGIIDILQSYRFIKKLEHTWKALVHDGDTVSVHRPGFYAERFFKFMTNTVFGKTSSLKSSPSKKGRSVLLAHSIGPSSAYSAGQISDQNEEGQYELRVASSCPTLDENGRPDILPCTTPSFEEATTISLTTTLSSTSLSIPERSPSETSEQPRYRRRTHSSGYDARTHEIPPYDETEQVTVEMEQSTVSDPEEEKHGEASSCVARAFSVEETGSQRSEEDEEVPVTDIYFPPDDQNWVYSPLHYTAQTQPASDEEIDT